MPIIGQAGLVVLTRDKRIRSRPLERQALLDHGVRACFLTSGGTLDLFSQLRLWLRYWDDIESLVAEQPAPWLASVTRTGVRVFRHPMTSRPRCRLVPRRDWKPVHVRHAHHGEVEQTNSAGATPTVWSSRDPPELGLRSTRYLNSPLSDVADTGHAVGFPTGKTSTGRVRRCCRRVGDQCALGSGGIGRSR